MKPEVVVIGLHTQDDLFTLGWIATWLMEERPGMEALVNRIRCRSYDSFDMASMPEKGDALDAIGEGTQLVIALHLFGIDKLPGGHTAEATALDPARLYNGTLERSNCHLLQLCMKHGATLIAVGDQPWLGIEKRTPVHREPEIVAYEKKERAMIVFEDERTTVEVNDDPSQISIYPRPLHDPERTLELRRLFPVELGWLHARFAVYWNLGKGKGRTDPVLAERLARAIAVIQERVTVTGEKKTLLRIDELFAFIASDSDGEGLPAVTDPGNGMLMPLVCADKERVESMRQAAKRIARVTGNKITLVRFSVREELEVIEP